MDKTQFEALVARLKAKQQELAGAEGRFAAATEALEKARADAAAEFGTSDVEELKALAARGAAKLEQLASDAASLLSEISNQLGEKA